MPRRRSAWTLALSFSLILASGPVRAQALSISEAGNEVISDFKCLANNTFMDVEDVVTSPL